MKFIIKNNKCWYSYEENKFFVHHWWQHEIIRATVENSMAVPQKAQNLITVWLKVSLSPLFSSHLSHPSSLHCAHHCLMGSILESAIHVSPDTQHGHILSYILTPLPSDQLWHSQWPPQQKPEANLVHLSLPAGSYHSFLQSWCLKPPTVLGTVGSPRSSVSVMFYLLLRDKTSL